MSEAVRSVTAVGGVSSPVAGASTLSVGGRSCSVFEDGVDGRVGRWKVAPGGVGADGVGREAEAADDVRSGKAVDGHERWRRSRRTQLMVLMIKELTQQAQATTASQRSTRGVARAMAIAMTAKPIAAAMARVLVRVGPFPEDLFERGVRSTSFLRYSKIVTMILPYQKKAGMMDKDLKKIVKALRAAGYDVSPTRRGHIRVSRDGRAVTTFSGTASDWRAHRNALAALRRDGFQWPPGR